MSAKKQSQKATTLDKEFNTAHTTFTNILKSTLSTGISNVQVFADKKVINALGWKNKGLPFHPLEDGRNMLRLPAGSLTAMCQNQLSETYIRQTLMGWRWEPVDEDLSSSETNLILIQMDESGAIRGFSLCHVEGKSPVDATMEVLVLGNAETPLAARKGHDGLRSGGRYARGGNTLKMIQVLGSMLKKGIFLYALETVITLYYYFGWRFKSSCQSKERNNYAGDVEQLKNFYKKWGSEEINFKNAKDEENFNKAFKKVLKPFHGWAKHRFREMLVSRFSDSDQDTFAEALEEARNNGFGMLLCQNLNPYSNLQIDQITTSLPKESKGCSRDKKGGGIRTMFDLISVSFKAKRSSRKSLKRKRSSFKGKRSRIRRK